MSSGFDLTNNEDNTKSVSINLTSLGLVNIYKSTSNSYITADIESSSSSNITYTENNKATEYKAKKLYIIGKAGGNALNEIIGVANQDGQVVIEATNTNNTKTLYFCIPIYTSSSVGQTDIDTLIQYSNGGATQLNANFQKTIDDNITPSNGSPPIDIRYIIYYNNENPIITLGTSIPIISTYIKELQNNFDFLGDPNPQNYSVCKSPLPGEWMECDYVDIDSDEVASYNLPVGSGLVQDNAAYNSLRTMMMYIIFIIFSGLSYIIVPHTYIFILNFIFNLSDIKNPAAQTKQMGNFDFIMGGIVGILIFALILAGVISTSSVAPVLLLYGVLLGIFVLLCHIIITSKKSADSTWPISEIQKSYVK